LNSSSRSASSHALVPYGWDEGWEAEFSSFAARGLVPGRVVRVDRGLCDVVTPAGVIRADTEFVVPRDPMKVVCTGDWGAVDPEGASPRFVRTLLPRRTAFVRSTSSKRSEGQVLAANVDHVVIAVSLAVELDYARVERFLALAWERDGSCSGEGVARHETGTVADASLWEPRPPAPGGLGRPSLHEWPGRRLVTEM
jgi:ribosome biogenesis GTPase